MSKNTHTPGTREWHAAEAERLFKKARPFATWRGVWRRKRLRQKAQMHATLAQSAPSEQTHGSSAWPH